MQYCVWSAILISSASKGASILPVIDSQPWVILTDITQRHPGPASVPSLVINILPLLFWNYLI